MIRYFTLGDYRLQVNKLWSQTKSKAKTIDIWESYKEDPETYKVRHYKEMMILICFNLVSYVHIA
jgi:hypothetical protein